MIFLAVFAALNGSSSGRDIGSAFLFISIAGLAAVASARKHSKAKPKETEALKKISSMVNRSLELNVILNSALEEIIASLGMDAGMFRLRATPEVSSKAAGRGFTRETAAILEESSEETSDLPSEVSKWSGSPLADALRKDGLSFFATYPIRSGNRVLGSLSLASHDSKSISELQEEFINALSEILGVAIVNSRLREQSHKLSEDLVALQEVNKIISQGFNLDDIIHRIVIEGKRLAKTSQCHLFLLDDQRQCLVGSASTQSKVGKPHKGHGAPGTGWCWSHRPRGSAANAISSRWHGARFSKSLSNSWHCLAGDQKE